MIGKQFFCICFVFVGRYVISVSKSDIFQGSLMISEISSIIDLMYERWSRQIFISPLLSDFH